MINNILLQSEIVGALRPLIMISPPTLDTIGNLLTDGDCLFLDWNLMLVIVMWMSAKHWWSDNTEDDVADNDWSVWCHDQQSHGHDTDRETKTSVMLLDYQNNWLDI